MKNVILYLFLIVMLSSCKSENKVEGTTILADQELSTAQKIANAHGFHHWKNVKTFEFTFGGKMEDPSSGRSWTWHPKSEDVTLKTSNDTITYNRRSMDSSALRADRAFINDKFWALIPFQLVWDEGLTFSEKETAISPIKQKEYSKITITYANDVGYTPGDAYDLYFDDDHIIREWNFRKSNDSVPTLSNTFENYQDFNGLKIALSHKRNKDDWNLLIRNVKVVLDD
ncbi:MAG: hypothetical protein KJO77_11270 [Bacteroidia bacterium]|nr:hypothetical protein [Bacteroidia bacterium]NND52729.1 hypothetical protein [Flavobacteriaceae bacterium]